MAAIRTSSYPFAPAPAPSITPGDLLMPGIPPMANLDKSDKCLRSVLGPNLQTGSMRAILLLAAFSLVGAIVAFLLS